MTGFASAVRLVAMVVLIAWLVAVALFGIALSADCAPLGDCAPIDTWRATAEQPKPRTPYERDGFTVANDDTGREWFYCPQASGFVPTDQATNGTIQAIRGRYQGRDGQWWAVWQLPNTQRPSAGKSETPTTSRDKGTAPNCPDGRCKLPGG